MPYQFSGRRSGVAFREGCNFLAFLGLFWSHTTGSRYDIYGRRCSLRCFVFFLSRRVLDWNMLLMKEILHHQGCIKPCKWGKLLINRSAGFLWQNAWLYLWDSYLIHGAFCQLPGCHQQLSKLHAWNVVLKFKVEAWMHRSIAFPGWMCSGYCGRNLQQPPRMYKTL